MARIVGPIRQIAANASVETLADWLELVALVGQSKSASIQDLVSLVRLNGTIEELLDPDDPFDRGSEEAQETAEAAFGAISSRLRTCGDEYPFNVTSQSITAKESAVRSVYAFLMLLSAYGKDAAGSSNSGAKLFEEVAGTALNTYLGGSTTQSRTYQFGFPRRLLPTGFRAALDDMCAKMEEGGGSRDRPTSGQQNDAKLDIVGWIPMPDARPGKLMIFGQCATGWNWTDKMSEMQAGPWCDHWMIDTPPVKPLRSLFVPHCIPDDWLATSRYSGVLFDRNRIAALCANMGGALRESVAAWNSAAIESGDLP